MPVLQKRNRRYREAKWFIWEQTATNNSTRIPTRVCLMQRPCKDPKISSLLEQSPTFLLVCMLSRFSCVLLFTMLWITPLSMGISRQAYWVGCHAPLQGICPNQGSNLLSQVGSLPLAPPGKHHTLLTPQYICPGYFLGLTVTPMMVGSSGWLTPPLSGSSTG